MNPLFFTTGFPLGKLAILFALSVLAVGGLVVAASALRGRPRRPARASAGAATAALAGAVLWVNVAAARDLDVKPAIRGPAEVAGRWVGPAAALELRPDGTFACVGAGCAPVAAAGRWILDGFEVLLVAPDVPRSYRVLRYRGSLRLAPPFADPDSWDGRLLFERIGPAA